MIGRWISPFRREATWILFLTSVVVLSLAVIHLKRTAAAAHVRLLPLADWRLGATRLAFCSEQAASFRGWDLRAGPIQLYYLGRVQAPSRPETPPPATEPELTDAPAASSELGPVIETWDPDPSLPTFQSGR